MKWKKGFLLTDLLFSLLAVSLMVPLTITCLLCLSGGVKKEERMQDEIGIAQLRRYLLCTDQMEVGDDTIHFDKKNKQMCLQLSNRHLAVTPGFQMFLDNIDDVSFEEENSRIIMTYWKEGEERKALLYEE